MVALVYLVHRFWGGWFVWLDWEDIIIHGVLDNVFFFLVFILVQVICVQSVVQKSYGSIFCVALCGWMCMG